MRLHGRAGCGAGDRHRSGGPETAGEHRATVSRSGRAIAFGSTGTGPLGIVALSGGPGGVPDSAGLPVMSLALCGDGVLLVGGVFLVYGTLQVPQSDRGEESAEPGGGPQVLDGPGQESPRGEPGAAGPVGDAGGGFEEVGEFGDAGVFGYVSAPAGRRVGELGDTAAVSGRQA